MTNAENVFHAEILNEDGYVVKHVPVYGNNRERLPEPTNQAETRNINAQLDMLFENEWLDRVARD